MHHSSFLSVLFSDTVNCYNYTASVTDEQTSTEHPPDQNPGQSVWNLQRTKRQWEGFSSKYFGRMNSKLRQGQPLYNILQTLPVIE
jgi:hypothetical protein